MTELMPVPAATVILARDSDAGLEVLMVQRNLSSGFVPGAYLFPGGALEAEDGAAETLALCSGVTDAQASRALGIVRGGLAYWAAAIRESFEEAGLLVAYDAGRRIVALDEPEAVERYRRHRHALNAGERGLSDILRQEKLTLAADRLVYFSHWITPVTAPRRYDTRFFVGAAPPAQAPLHDNEETINHVWVRPGDALERHRSGNFKMRFPTARTLGVLAAHASVDALMQAMRAKREVRTMAPRTNKEGVRLLPGDPGYDELAGRERQGQWKI